MKVYLHLIYTRRYYSPRVSTALLYLCTSQIPTGTSTLKLVSRKGRFSGLETSRSAHGLKCGIRVERVDIGNDFGGMWSLCKGELKSS